MAAWIGALLAGLLCGLGVYGLGVLMLPEWAPAEHTPLLGLVAGLSAAVAGGVARHLSGAGIGRD